MLGSVHICATCVAVAICRSVAKESHVTINEAPLDIEPFPEIEEYGSKFELAFVRSWLSAVESIGVAVLGDFWITFQPLGNILTQEGVWTKLE